MNRDANIITIGTDGRGELPSVNAVGFSLKSRATNRKGFPITAHIDGDETTSLTVDSGATYSQEVPIKKLTLVGGVKGDVYEVDLQPAPSDWREERNTRDARGNLRTVGPGPCVLFDVTIEGTSEQQLPGTVYINPAGGEAGESRVSYSNTPGKAWDVSSFRFLKLLVMRGDNPPPMASIVAAIELADSVEPASGVFANELPDAVPIIGDFGTAGSARRAYALTGVPLQQVENNSHHLSPRISPYARFTVQTSGSFPGWANNGGGKKLRLIAMGW